ncbi:MAG: pirin family protein [Myxococcota bacterium]
MSANPILGIDVLGAPPWRTADPFLFCVHHDDAYPKGTAQQGPAASLAGRNLGNDFTPLDGWRMYHGDVVPGFPRHPHRGFETVTVVRRGFVDHSDSLGATARYGNGDVQWMTAGRGIVHAEMFPLTRRDQDNPLELFQIWINLPARSKMVEPHFTMLWDESVPEVVFTDDDNRKTAVTLSAGELEGKRPPAPAPNSWAADPSHEVAIWQIRMDGGARFEVPAASTGVNRTFYVFRGAGIDLAGQSISNGRRVEVRADQPVAIRNGFEPTEILMLQGRPIGEPVANYGPFVMNTRAELEQAFADYRRTQFGGWPWRRDDPVHAATERRFAKHPDGHLDKPV